MDRFLYDNGLRHERVNAFLFSCDEMFCPLGAFHQKNLRDAAIISSLLSSDIYYCHQCMMLLISPWNEELKIGFL